MLLLCTSALTFTHRFQPNRSHYLMQKQRSCVKKRVWSTMLLLNAIRGYIEAAIRPVIYLETAFQRCLIVGTPFFFLSLFFSPLFPRSRLILPPPVILLRLSLCSSHGVPAPYVACELGKIPCLYLKRATMRGNSKKGNKAARL